MAMPPIRFSREYATIVRTEGRRASHPAFGETVLSAHFSGTAHRYCDRGERAGLLTSESSSGPAFPTLPGQWHFWGLRRPLQRRNRPGFTPGSLFSCSGNHRHSFKNRRSTIFCGPFQRTTQDVAFFAWIVKHPSSNQRGSKVSGSGILHHRSVASTSSCLF